jgi:hypothetical protein
VGRLVGLVLVLTLLAGAAMSVYNVYRYEVLSPFPLSWTHDPADLELVELMQTHEALTQRLGSTRRIEGASGLAVLAPDGSGAEIEAELAVLDQKIAVLRARVATGRDAPAAKP